MPVGLETCFSLFKSTIRQPQDSIIVCIHNALVHNGFTSIGIGEEAPTSNEEVIQTELLPLNWNESPDCFAIKYQVRGTANTHILKAIKMDNAMYIHFMRMCDEVANSISVNIQEYASNDTSSYESAYVNADALHKRFEHEILAPLRPSTASSRSQTNNPGERSEPDGGDDPLKIPSRSGPPPPRQPNRADPNDPFSIGRADLDPLASGGGMVFDPMRSGGRLPGVPDLESGMSGQIPRGSVPPGARFDPIGPPRPGRNPGGPNPDHLPPPGYDDMFM